jgi:RimJ/RimL family protein N-acetyltransferase
MTALDQDWVFSVRNSEEVRLGARDGSLITRETHHDWWEEGEGCDRFVFEWQGNRAGVVLKGANDYWSFYLDPNFMRKGLGLIMLALYLAYYRATATKPLKARVKKDNLSSIKLHHRLGFKRIQGRKPGLLEYRLNVT